MYEFTGQLIIILVILLAFVIAFKFDKSVNIFKNVFSKKTGIKVKEAFETKLKESKEAKLKKNTVTTQAETNVNQSTENKIKKDNSTQVSKYFSEAFVTVKQRNCKEKKYLIDEGITFGRSERNDVVLNHPEVSRDAFSVGYDDKGYFLTVSDQRGFMNSSKVIVKRGTSVSLEDGDSFYFAEYKVTYSSYLCDIDGFNDESNSEDELNVKRIVRRN